jgi:hypothetical protein
MIRCSMYGKESAKSITCMTNLWKWLCPCKGLTPLIFFLHFMTSTLRMACSPLAYMCVCVNFIFEVVYTHNTRFHCYNYKYADSSLRYFEFILVPGDRYLVADLYIHVSSFPNHLLKRLSSMFLAPLSKVKRV